MSSLLHEIVRGVHEEISLKLPTLSSEKSRKEMRSSLLALEKMTKHIRQELMKESKELTLARKEKRINKKNNKNNSNNIVENEEEKLDV